MLWKKYGKLFVVPVLAIVGIGAGAVGGAYAIDQLGAKYLWPEPESLVVVQATPEPIRTNDEFSEGFAAPELTPAR
ncbi:MAG: hypothetical protein AAGH99_04690 [Planctomycetota bacterium]